jgi:hypothetical protein
VKNLLQEYIKDILTEKLRSKIFNINEFKRLKNLGDIWNYAYDNLEFLGAGSSRGTWLLSSGKVLKVARWDAELKGLSQNEAEVKIYTDLASTKFVAKIFDYDKQYQWLISELVKPIKSEDEFCNLLDLNPQSGFDFKTLAQLGELGYNEARHIAAEENINLPDKTWDFIIAYEIFLNNHGLIPADIRVLSHWGKTASGNVALLDYGYDQNISGHLYRKQDKNKDLGDETTPINKEAMATQED